MQPPLLKRPGSKNRLMPWVRQYFPHKSYLSACVGGGSDIILKEPSKYEAANDLDGDVINFYDQFVSRFDDFLFKVSNTPYHQAVCTRAFEYSPDPFIRAFNLYVRSWMSRSLLHDSLRVVIDNVAGGHIPPVIWGRTEHLYEIRDRLKNVTWFQEDFLTLIERYISGRNPGELLLFVDPPYLSSTRKNPRLYKMEFNTLREHHLLSILLRRANDRGVMVIICGYESPFYARFYEDFGWKRVFTTALDEAKNERIECLWLSPNTVINLEKK